MSETTFRIAADVCAGISALKANPMEVITAADGAPVAILNRNEPFFYAVPAKTFEAIIERLDDLELLAHAHARQKDAEIDVTIDDL